MRYGRPLLLLLGTLAAGCGPSSEAIEVGAVLRAVDVLRDAPSEPLAARQAFLADLERQPVTLPLTRDARDACAHAYRLLLDGSALEARVRQALTGPGGTGALSDLADLAAADGKIKESAAAMPACDTALAALRRADRAR